MTRAKSHSHRLLFTDLEREIEGLDGETIFHAARRNGIRIVGACGGRGTCGSCMVRIAHAGGDPAQHHRWRRACQVPIRSDSSVTIAPRSLAPIARAEIGHAEAPPLPLDPVVTGRDIQVPEATLDDPRGDWERLLGQLGETLDLPEPAALRDLPDLLRANGWRVRVRRQDGRVQGFAPPGRPELGLAVDLGTTNLAAFLIRLETGERLATLGIENPQTAWGGDLISRINHAIQDKHGPEDLRRAILSGLNGVIRDLAAATDSEAADVVDAVICGNTAMHHLLAGLPVRQLGKAPFVPAVCAALDMDAAALGLELAPGARVHLAPNIGGFVGGDHVTALLATEEHWQGRTALVMDIGTNTEISLIHDGVILSASCPSGPALEGGHIACGMRAAIGAIERVWVDNGRLAVATIGHKKPIGLCGSGVLDTVAALLGGGLMDGRGRLATGHPDVGEEDGLRFARLAADVHFTQHDIRAVQLAKSAIRTGTDLLLRQAGIGPEHLERFVIAGAFGAYISVESAVAIGLLPDVPRDRILQVGNAAGVGVARMLTSRTERRRADEIAATARYVELSSIADFQKHFLKNISLGNHKQERTAP